MKKILSLSLFLAAGGVAFTQTFNNGLYKPDLNTVRWGGPLNENTTIDLSNNFFFNVANGGTNYFKILPNGNVGIGAYGADPSTQFSLGNNLANSKLALWDGSDGLGGRLRYGFGVQPWQFRLHLPDATARFSFLSDEAGSNELMTIQGNGNVGIGTANPQGKLAVKGVLYAQKVIVTMTGWADYVFDPKYQLRPLNELEQYIQQQQHLPEIPTTAEVQNNGIDVGENQTLLLKKVEELTLYIIDLNKQVKSQQEEINSLKRKLKK
ncbi:MULTISPECIES: hypothetical protein [Niastella]|uniref:BZIP transcription factor n=1 Tax=Niastella soli TaxID=2821487 RepID=A0ABS3Z418_9BACT|nr:hypothetical protein [Niastella soli]MBO9204904.1 hypothetical protein [Niastella soli]